MGTRASNLFFRVISVTIAVLGVSKLYLSMSDEPQLRIDDPVFQYLSLRQSTFIASTIELISGYYLFTNSSNYIRSVVVFWLAGVFLCYKIIIVVFNLPRPCKCLGIIHNLLGMSSHFSELVTWILIAIMLIGSATVFFRKQDNIAANAFIK